jgi:hypothetical protein
LVLLLFLLGNPNFTGGTARFFRYLIFLTGFIAVLFQRGKSRNPFTKFLIAFFLLEMVVIGLFGKMPILSALKLTLFTTVVYTILEAFFRTRRLKLYYFKLINSFFIFSVAGSLIFLLIGFGFERNNTGFQGIFAHPQTFGPMMAVISAWFAGIWLSAKRPPFMMPFLVGTSLVFLYISLSRTAMGALILGGGIAYFLSIISKTKIPNHKRLYQLAGFVMIGLIFSAAVNPSKIQDLAIGFLQKRESSSTNVGELFEQSRGFLIESSIKNFDENPIVGIGLGVPTDYEDADLSKYQSVGGIPISASVEKGFLPAAILEEMGILGMALTIIMLIILVKRVQKRFSYMGLWLLISALLINAGEAVLFSVGGLGLFVWLIVGMTYSNDLLLPQKFTVKKIKDETKPVLRVV